MHAKFDQPVFGFINPPAQQDFGRNLVICIDFNHTTAFSDIRIHCNPLVLP